MSKLTTRLEARALELAYPSGARALAGVNLKVASGELLSIVGPNGAGKSTLLRCLAGLLEPTAGAVEIDGAPLGALRPLERARRVAFVPQFLPAVPDVLVEDFVLGGRYAHIDRWRGPTRADYEAVERALSACGAAELRERLLTELSGGQRQRVLLARAAAQSAPVIVVDEPTAALDPAHQVAVFALLASLAREGRCVVLATHELSLASRASDTIALLVCGQVRAVGAPLEVLQPRLLREVYGPDLLIEARDGGVLVAPWARLG